MLLFVLPQIMGTVIHGDSRLQMSIRVPGNENLRGFDKIKEDLYIPIFWGYKVRPSSDFHLNILMIICFCIEIGNV